MPRPEPEKNGKTEKKDAAPRKSRRPPLTRRGKWSTVLLSLLCLVLTCALFLEEIMPRLIERNVNWVLRHMAEGGGAEFRIKSISLSSAEIACKLTDTSDDKPRNVGGIGSFSIRFSPIPFLFDRRIDAVIIENCDVTADYDGSFSIPAYKIFAKSFQSDGPKEKRNTAVPDDLNAVIPVKVGCISVSGSLSAEFHDEDAVDILHIPYEIKVCPDPEQHWNKLNCSLEVRFATNALLCRATYLHRDKELLLDLEKFALSTTAMPGTVRSALPRGLRAGLTLGSKAKVGLDPAGVSVFEDSSVDGKFSLAYRRPDGLRINTETPFSVKMLPDQVVSLTVGAMNGKYDTIPFEVSGLEMAVSLSERTVKGGFQFTAADSETARFSIDGGLNSERTGLSITLDNDPLLKAAYRGIDLAFRPGRLAAEVDVTDGEITASAEFACTEIRAELDGAAFDPEFKGLSAALRPESFSAHFRLENGQAEASAELAGGELGAGYNGTNVVLRPETIRAGFETFAGEAELSAGLTGGELKAEKDGMEVSFLPETLSATCTTSDDGMEISVELAGRELKALMDGMTCSAEKLEFNAGTDGAQEYTADAKLHDFQFGHQSSGLIYEAPELGLDAEILGGILSGEAVCDDSTFSMPEKELFAKDLRWRFPFDQRIAPEDEEIGSEDVETGIAENESGGGPGIAQAEQPDGPRRGRFSLGDLEFKGNHVAALDGTIRWDAGANAIRMETDNARLLSIDSKIYGNVVLGDGVETECGITIPDQDVDLSKDLALFFPQFKEISCTGRLGGSAVYRVLSKTKTDTGYARFHIADADVFIPEQKLEVRGIGLGFEIPNLTILKSEPDQKLSLKSAPGQMLSFKSVKYDRIETGAGRAAFRMEAPDTWQVENALLDWCGGHIRLGGTTYRAGQTTTEAVLYCDRLELPLFLTQIGLGQISGSGSINGTIPVVLVQKTDASGKAKIDNIYFDDAFLFSTPGEDGMIKGELDEALVDEDSGIEMELSKDALKDFTYSWVRMRMISTGPDKENLKLELQLDGRPNRALYYAFDENTASFVKSPTPCIFQGIRLDTNVSMYGKAMELVDYFQQIFSKSE